MSLISVIATDKFISFMSDGRVIENDEIINESYKKIFKVNEKIIFGMAGSYNALQIILKHLDDFNQENAREFNKSLFKELAGNKTHHSIQMVVGGLDENNKIYYGGFNQESHTLEEIWPHLTRSINFASTEINIDSDIGNQQRLKKLIENNTHGELKLKGTVLIQEKLNAQVSMIDNSVNTRTFHEYIKKP